MKKKSSAGRNKVGGPLSRIDARVFVTVWQKSSSVKEVASILGCNAMNCSVRANLMRHAGIPLKMFRRVKTNRMDIEMLKALAVRLNKENK